MTNDNQMDYFMNGNPDFLNKKYKESDLLYKPTVGYPSGVDKSKLEKIVDDYGKEVYKSWGSKGTDGNYPFKFFSYITMGNDRLNNVVFSNVQGFERIGVKLYQHNFTKSNRRYSVILITAKNKLKAVYYINLNGGLSPVHGIEDLITESTSTNLFESVFEML